jgi:hypothetical protein
MVSLLIAAKYEEIYVPEIEDFVYICAKAYNRQQVLSCHFVLGCGYVC